MTNIPVTGMSGREYARVFGAEPTPIERDEIIVDIGSGLSDLSSIAPDGYIAQLDPIYEVASDDGHCFRVPIELGASSIAKESIVNLKKLKADRVTCGNTLKHISREDRITVVSQLLGIGMGGIVQIYPVNTKKTTKLIDDVGDEGFEAILQQPNVSGPRQLIYKASRINAVFTILSQPPKAGPTQQLRVARLIAETM